MIIGYPKIKRPKAQPLDIQKIVSELRCRYCGRGFSSQAQLRGHLGQCLKRGAFLKKLERGIIVIVHKKYFYIKPKSISSLTHIEKFLALYRERNGQPELWEKDINTFLGALTALHMEKKLTFEMIEKEAAAELAHSVAEVYTDGSLQEKEEAAPMLDTTPLEKTIPGEVDIHKEAVPLVEVIKKRMRDSKGKKSEN